MGHRDIASTMVYLKGVRNRDIQAGSTRAASRPLRKVSTTCLTAQPETIQEAVRLLHPSGSICWQIGNYADDGEVFPLDILQHGHPAFFSRYAFHADSADEPMVAAPFSLWTGSGQGDAVRKRTAMLRGSRFVFGKAAAGPRGGATYHRI